MANMLPKIISPDVKSSAEKRIFDWFANARGTEEWYVLHSLGIEKHNHLIVGETDFLVIAENLGVFALEVKGGRISRTDGMWHYSNRYDETTTKSRGPFEQANDGIFSIMHELQNMLDNQHANLKDVLFGHGVMFPDVVFDATGVDEQQWRVFDENNMMNVRDYIINLSKEETALFKSKYPKRQIVLPTKDDVRYIAKLLRGDFSIPMSLNAKISNIEKEQMKLTDEQYNCLDQLDDNKRCVIQGQAGTGKTLLALKKATEMTASGEKVGLFCYNANLASWLKKYIGELPQNIQPAYVGTFHSWMIKIANEHGILSSAEENKSSEFYEATLPMAIRDAIEQENRFDYLVIDEAQDLIKENYLRVLNELCLNGLDRGRWSMFGDFDMQAIYADGESEQSLFDLLSDYSQCYARYKLKVNCRNTDAICWGIQTLTDVKYEKILSSGLNGMQIDYLTYKNDEDEVKVLRNVLLELQAKQIDPSIITILSPNRFENSVASKLSSEFGIEEYSAFANRGITFSTIQAFKGLENSVGILTDIKCYTNKKLMYVALSRARSKLYIIETEAAGNECTELQIRRYKDEESR